MFRRSNWCATVWWRGSGRVFGHWEELLRQMKAPVFARGLYTAPGALQGAWRNNLFRRSAAPLHGCTKHLCLNSLAPHLVVDSSSQGSSAI